MNQETNNNTEGAPKETTTPTNATLAPRTILIYILGTALIAGIAFYVYQELQHDHSHTDETPVTTLSVPGEGPVARVNGTEIARQDYQNRLDTITSTLSAQGINFTNDEIATSIRSQALNELINYQLLTEASADIQIAEKALDEAKQRITENVGGQAELEVYLEEQSLTMSELEVEIAEQLRVDAYVEQKTDLAQVTATGEEVEAYYQEVTAGLESAPDLEEVRDQLTLQLIQNKQRALLENVIEELRNEATIEVLI